jgi:hypothetical protein
VTLPLRSVSQAQGLWDCVVGVVVSFLTRSSTFKCYGVSLALNVAANFW